ncbi:hypothetical protein BJ684DRAFT_15453 [Piptocephalis cylindrospora]|uniref:Uncharacterized protein n=1 Tax=Piptocephalis cylindrospora TaxID=1907219 RepID=A0A4P9Y616_9FUNG|nr:hypothetical protein BJ684DRAFT_15453 [Piptocephalis cylindrospora]|eukprot:RKP14212.1 hypothetical protein BJ684DRAFT_15453 [Piptocephalis cylindrospora]
MSPSSPLASILGWRPEEDGMSAPQMWVVGEEGSQLTCWQNGVQKVDVQCRQEQRVVGLIPSPEGLPPGLGVLIQHIPTSLVHFHHLLDIEQITSESPSESQHALEVTLDQMILSPSSDSLPGWTHLLTLNNTLGSNKEFVCVPKNILPLNHLHPSSPWSIFLNALHPSTSSITYQGFVGTASGQVHLILREHHQDLTLVVDTLPNPILAILSYPSASDTTGLVFIGVYGAISSLVLDKDGMTVQKKREARLDIRTHDATLLPTGTLILATSRGLWFWDLFSSSSSISSSDAPHSLSGPSWEISRVGHTIHQDYSSSFYYTPFRYPDNLLKAQLIHDPISISSFPNHVLSAMKTLKVAENEVSSLLSVRKGLDESLRRLQSSMQWIQEGKITCPESMLRLTLRWHADGPVLHVEWAPFDHDSSFLPDFLKDWQVIAKPSTSQGITSPSRSSHSQVQVEWNGHDLGSFPIPSSSSNYRTYLNFYLLYHPHPTTMGTIASMSLGTVKHNAKEGTPISSSPSASWIGRFLPSLLGDKLEENALKSMIPFSLYASFYLESPMVHEPSFCSIRILPGLSDSMSTFRISASSEESLEVIRSSLVRRLNDLSASPGLFPDWTFQWVEPPQDVNH